MLTNMPGLVPIVIGVTGHRIFPAQDEALLQHAVNAQLDYFERTCKASPLILLTGLAEGADSMVAACAMQRGWKVYAVLASSPEKFALTLSSESARAHFFKLLKDCAWVSTVPASDDVAADPYELVSRFISIHSQWLIALWDGEPAQGKGGTAEVVDHFLHGSAPLGGSMPDTGPVIRIVTRRSMDADVIAADQVGNVHMLPPDPCGFGGGDEGIRQWERILARINDFNKLVQTKLIGDAAALLKASESLRSRDAAAASTDIPSGFDKLGCLFAAADRIAGQYQKIRQREYLWMMTFSLLAVMAEQLYTGPLEGRPMLLVFAMACVALAFVPVVLAKCSSLWGGAGHEAIYLDCRSLAEACRVHYYWRLNGLAESAADYHLAEQRDELEWIRQALRNMDLGAAPSPIPADIALEDTLSYWIRDQKVYLLGTAKKQGRVAHHLQLSRRLDGLALGFLGLTLLLVMVTLWLEFSGMRDAPVMQGLQAGWGIALACAAAVKVFQRTQGYHEHACSYGRMGLSFSLAEGQLLRGMQAENPSAACAEVLLDIGKAALQENSDWLLLHRQRPAGPPIG